MSESKKVAKSILLPHEVVMNNMFNRFNHIPEMIGFDNEINHLEGLIRRCITHGESNSTLVIGSRGSGKSLLVNTALKNVLSGNMKDASCFLVRLNGLLQTDDNIALEEITKQLNLGNVIDGLVFGTFPEKLQFLLESLKTGSRTTKPILFILDEFDLFTQHKSQTLLYNLFDISQSHQTPVCIIGITCRLDVTELLEKRVKSRFSHRVIHMFINMDYSKLKAIALYYLSLPIESNKKRNNFTLRWNERAESLMEDPTVKDAFMFNFNITKDISALKKILAAIVGRCATSDVEEQLLEKYYFLEALKVIDQESKAAILQGVSVLELCLIVAMKQLCEIYSEEIFNFYMVYEHYKKFSDHKASLRTFDKAIAMKAFEHLVDLEIVKPTERSAIHVKEYRSMRLQVECREIEEAVSLYNGCPSDIRQWALSDLTTH